MSINIEEVQKHLDRDQEIRKLFVTLNGVGFGFGLTETELSRLTGLEVQKLRSHIARLQYLGIINVKCTQVGTAGPYDYFFSLVSEIKAEVSITMTNPSKSS